MSLIARDESDLAETRARRIDTNGVAKQS